MYIEDFRLIITKLVEGKKYREEYLDTLNKVDSSLSSSIFENKYSDSLGNDNDFLIKELFGKELIDHVMWFLYEWHPGYKVCYNNVDYYIMNIDDFIDATEQMYGLPMRPRGV